MLRAPSSPPAPSSASDRRRAAALHVEEHRDAAALDLEPVVGRGLDLHEVAVAIALVGLALDRGVQPAAVLGRRDRHLGFRGQEALGLVDEVQLVEQVDDEVRPARRLDLEAALLADPDLGLRADEVPEARDHLFDGLREVLAVGLEADVGGVLDDAPAHEPVTASLA